MEIKRGNVTVKIYQGKNRLNRTTFDQYTMVDYDGPQRKKKRIADLEEAKREAEFSVTKLANGENEILRLTPSDRSLYVQSVEVERCPHQGPRKPPGAFRQRLSTEHRRRLRPDAPSEAGRHGRQRTHEAELPHADRGAVSVRSVGAIARWA